MISTTRSIALLYAGLNQRNSRDDIFRNWLHEWEIVHGQLERKRVIDRRALAAKYGITSEEPGSVARLLFCIETYFVFLLRCLVFRATHANIDRGGATHVNLSALYTDEVLGGLPITNFNHASHFDWLGAVTDSTLLASLRDDLASVFQVSHSPVEIARRGLIRSLYHDLFPKQARHALGSYYTPRWLAEYMLDEALKLSSLDRGSVRILDPTCGSGIFLTAALERLGQRNHGTGKIVLSDICGFDINPLAVFAAKTNVLLYGVDELRKRKAFTELPIYVADSIDAPFPTWPRAPDLFSNDVHALHVGHVTVDVPIGLVNDADALNQLMQSLRSRSDWAAVFDKFPAADRLKAQATAMVNAIAHLRAPERLIMLDAIRDRVRPVHAKDYDIVIGNPPWVNWEYLPSDYRKQISGLWPTYGLFSLNGRDKAFSKEDISGLATYVAAERYLRTGGVLAFLLPQSLFKSALNARGFRKFFLLQSQAHLGVHHVDDFVDVQPFRGVSNRPTALFAVKGQTTAYPVSWNVWQKTSSGRLCEETSYRDVNDKISCTPLRAMPSNAADKGSNWVTGNANSLSILEKLEGPNPYRARTGVFTGGANGVYYLEILGSADENKQVLRVRNVTERAKRLVSTLECDLEGEHVYPFLRGRDVAFWKHKVVLSIVAPHTAITKMKAIREVELQKSAPRTLAYLKMFEPVLRERRGFVTWDRQAFTESFYSLQRLGAYTFKPFKVVWKYIAKHFTPCVVPPHSLVLNSEKPVLPQEKLMMIGFEDATEAYYVCAVLSSSPARLFIESRMVSTQIAPHVINNLAVPTYSRSDSTHVLLANACRDGHAAANLGDAVGVTSAQRTIDALLPELMPITRSEMLEMRGLLAI